MDTNEFSVSGCIITLVGLFSFLGLLAINLVVAFACLIDPSAFSLLFLPGFTIVVWGIWYGIVLVVKAKRTSA